MPTLRQLGPTIASKVRGRPSVQMLPEAARFALARGGIPSGDLEVWLSSLASPGPYTSTAEQHFYAGIFTEITADVGDEIELCESRVYEATKVPPEWLTTLVRIWNGIGASVITFNYDTLVEHAATLIEPTDDRWPGVAFKLLKLHGSSDWWRPRGDPTGMTMEWRTIPGWRVSHFLPDREGERLLIPPIASKSPFYDFNIIRSEWEGARRALEMAERLFIMGYSLPATDLATAALLGDHLAPRARVTLVDAKPSTPRLVLKRLGHPPEVTISGPDCIEKRFIDEYQEVVGRELVPRFAERLKSVRGDPAVLARLPGDPTLQAIRALTTRGKRLIATTTGSPLLDSDARTAVRTRRLRRALTQLKAQGGGLVVRTPRADHLALATISPFIVGAREWTAIET